jgi:hypothetical protein
MKRQSLMRKETSARNSMASGASKSFMGRSGRSGKMGASMRAPSLGKNVDAAPPSASTSISRPMALQQYDLGYKIFVKERMLAIAESEDAQKHLLEKEKLKGKGGGSIPVARVGTDRGSPEGSLAGSSRRASMGGRAASPEERKVSLGGSAASSSSPRKTLSPQRSFNSSTSHAQPGSVKGSSGLVRVPRVPGLAGEPLLTDAHPVVQKSISNLNSAHALTAASMARAILESLDSKDMEYLQQVRLFSLQKEFSAVYEEQRKSRVGLFFSLPIFLMFLRLSIQSLFTTMYPLWSRTKDGHESLASMDKVCCDLLDPHGYLERNLSILQSSPSAIDVISKNPSKGHEAEHFHFTDTSSLLRSALLSPSSAATRRIMVAQSQKAALKPQAQQQVQASKKLSTQLTSAQREELYADARKQLEARSKRK